MAGGNDGDAHRFSLQLLLSILVSPRSFGALAVHSGRPIGPRRSSMRPCPVSARGGSLRPWGGKERWFPRSAVHRAILSGSHGRRSGDVIRITKKRDGRGQQQASGNESLSSGTGRRRICRSSHVVKWEKKKENPPCRSCRAAAFPLVRPCALATRVPKSMSWMEVLDAAEEREAEMWLRARLRCVGKCMFSWRRPVAASNTSRGESACIMRAFSGTFYQQVDRRSLLFLLLSLQSNSPGYQLAGELLHTI